MEAILVFVAFWGEKFRTDQNNGDGCYDSEK